MKPMYEKRSPESKDNNATEDIPRKKFRKTKVTNPEVPFPHRVIESLKAVAFTTAPLAANPKTSALSRKNGISKLLLDCLTSVMIDERYEDGDPGFRAINQLLLQSMEPLAYDKVI